MEQAKRKRADEVNNELLEYSKKYRFLCDTVIECKNRNVLTQASVWAKSSEKLRKELSTQKAGNYKLDMKTWVLN